MNPESTIDDAQRHVDACLERLKAIAMEASVARPRNLALLGAAINYRKAIEALRLSLYPIDYFE